MDLLTPRARAAPGAQPPRPGAAVGGVRRGGAGAGVPGQEDVAQGRAARSARRRRSRQHLRERGAASGRVVAARRASTIATASGAPRDAADRLAAAIKRVLTTAIIASDRHVPIVPVPRLRSRRRAVPAPRVRRDDQATDAGGPVDVLLSRLPAITTAVLTSCNRSPTSLGLCPCLVLCPSSSAMFGPWTHWTQDGPRTEAGRATPIPKAR